MSWNRSFATWATFELDEPEFGSEDVPQDQYLTARHAARALIHSGAVGDSATCDFSIYLSGHSNPNHQPTPGFANDCVTVGVTQRPKELA